MIKQLVKKFKYELSYQSGRYLFPPDFLTFNITFRCNFRCESCNAWNTDSSQESADQSWLDFFASLPPQLPPETILEFSGGEPLLKKELIAAGLKILSPHFKKISLNTNGSLLDDATAGQLARLGISEIKISLYSLEEDIHNRLRGAANAYGLAQQAISAALGAGLKTEIGVLITRQNITTIPALVSGLAGSDAKINLQLLGEKYLTPANKNLERNEMIESLWPTRGQIEEFFSWLKTADREKIKNSEDNIRLTRLYYREPELLLKRRCFAGQKNAIINPDGKVYLCFSGSQLGNAFETKLLDLLSGELAQQERVKYQKCGKYCRAKGCNYSRGFREIILDLLPKK